MNWSLYIRRSIIALTCLSLLAFARSSHADEIWVAPTYQADLGAGIGNGVWPVTALGAVRLAVAVPNDLENFQFARIAVIPGAPGGSAVLHFYVCSAQNSTLVGASCAGPIDQAFTGVANQLVEVDISAGLASHVSGPGVRYLGVLVYTTPTTTTDHIVGMRFGYEATAVVGPVGPTGPQGIEGPQGPDGSQGIQGPQGLTGAQGTQGEVGPTGATGLQGIQGPIGVTGAQGPQGVQGPMPAGAALVNAANVFTATQTINTGNLDLDPSTSTTGVITKNGVRFLHNVGTNNTFLGLDAGNLTMTGDNNTASGYAALNSNTTGDTNTATGSQALPVNTIGSHNTATGANALRANTTGGNNVATGYNSLFTNTTGHENTATGLQALHINTSGSGNIAIGHQSLGSNTIGSQSVAVGFLAGANATTGSSNIYLGGSVLGVAGESNTMYLGKVGTQTTTFIAGVRGATTGVNNGIPVVIDSNGQLGTISSSRRFKEDIHDMSASLGDRLLRLRPVTFRYTQAYTDGSKPIQYGLVAEEVAEAFPELAVRNAAGEIETVHYETLNVLLLKQVQEQQAQLRLLQEQVKDLMQSRGSK